MSSRRLGLLTIGQAPRHDLAAAIERELDTEIEVVHAGVLDGLSHDEVRDTFAASSGERLISQLQDGTVVMLDADRVERHLSSLVVDLDEAGFACLVLLCTAAFPSLPVTSAPLIEPDHVLLASIEAMFGGRELGIIVPEADQVEAAEVKWSRFARRSFAVSSPYAQSNSSLVDAGKQLIASGAEVLVLDCMGYQRAHQETLREAGVTLPIAVSGEVVGRAIGAVLA